MYVKCVDLKFKRGQETAPFLVSSCKHIGLGSQSEEGMENLKAACGKHPWLDLGDMIEGIMPNDKRYMPTSGELKKKGKDGKLVVTSKRVGTLLNEISEAIRWTKKGKKNCWGILPGNHEDTASRQVGEVTGFIAQEAGVPYLTQTCFLRIHCPKGEAIVFVSHGHITINYKAGEPERRLANRKVRLRNELQCFHADACFVGHGHRKAVTEPIYEMKLTVESFEDAENVFDVKSRPVVTRPTWYAMAPSMFKVYTYEPNYAQPRLFPPTATGWLQANVARDGTIVSIDNFLHTGEIGKTHVPTVID